MPFISGMVRSISSRSGRSFSAIWTACRPLLGLPTTSMPRGLEQAAQTGSKEVVIIRQQNSHRVSPFEECRPLWAASFPHESPPPDGRRCPNSAPIPAAPLGHGPEAELAARSRQDRLGIEAGAVVNDLDFVTCSPRRELGAADFLWPRSACARCSEPPEGSAGAGARPPAPARAPGLRKRYLDAGLQLPGLHVVANSIGQGPLSCRI